jgi:hypothetical protein
MANVVLHFPSAVHQRGQSSSICHDKTKPLSKQDRSVSAIRAVAIMKEGPTGLATSESADSLPSLSEKRPGSRSAASFDLKA